MNDNQQTNPEEISGALKRVNRLGTATEQLFSRLYKGLTRRSQMEVEAELQRQQMAEQLEAVERIHVQNQHLEQVVHQREEEIKRLDGILASIDEGIIMQNNDGRIVLINNAARRLLGSQKNFWDSELGTLFDAYREITTVSTELAPLGEPTRIQANNRILGAQLAAVADQNGDRLGTMIVLRDVTREALNERLKEGFITHISHELKTPMTVIKLVGETLLGQPEDKPASRRLLETLGRNVDILDRMVVELLDISEISADSFSIRQDTLRLEEIIWSVVKGLKPEIEAANLDVTVIAREADNLYVKGDDQRLRWALGHLVRNSTYYTQAGGHIVIMAGTEDGERVDIKVIDTGVGISDKDLPHIFERFYRGEPRSLEGKRLDPRGLGQGLFVTRTVAESHGGYLSVQTKVGEGSTFTLSLPATSRSQ